MEQAIHFGEIIDDDAAGAEETVRRGFWRKLKRAARHIPFAEETVAAYYWAIDRATPTHVRATLFGALAYFVLPLDAIPDFIIGTGLADDAAILAAVFSTMRANILPRHRQAARSALGDRPT